MPSIWDIAEITIQDLRSLGYEQICVVGTAAAALYGGESVPQELDILALDSEGDEESIQAKLISANPAFFIAALPYQGKLTSPRHFWYDLYRLQDETRPESIKINILRPGSRSIPTFESPSIDQHDVPKSQTRLPTLALSQAFVIALHSWHHQRQNMHRVYTSRQERAERKRSVVSLAILMNKQRLSLKGDPLVPPGLLQSTEERGVEFTTAYRSGHSRIPDLQWLTTGTEAEKYTTKENRVDHTLAEVEETGVEANQPTAAQAGSISNHPHPTQTKHTAGNNEKKKKQGKKVLKSTNPIDPTIQANQSKKGRFQGRRRPKPQIRIPKVEGDADEYRPDSVSPDTMRDPETFLGDADWSD